MAELKKGRFCAGRSTYPWIPSPGITGLNTWWRRRTAELRKGEILCRALFISVDPITRYHWTKYFVEEKQ